MNPMLFRAVGVVTFALLFYTIAVVTEQRKSAVTRQVLWFLTAGIICDISSTALMIAGSGNIPITVHGFIGYSALIVMLIDTIMIWRLWSRTRAKITEDGTITDMVTDIPRSLHVYTRLAYSWWVIAYIAGGVIAMTIK